MAQKLKTERLQILHNNLTRTVFNSDTLYLTHVGIKLFRFYWHGFWQAVTSAKRVLKPTVSY